MNVTFFGVFVFVKTPFVPLASLLPMFLRMHFCIFFKFFIFFLLMSFVFLYRIVDMSLPRDHRLGLPWMISTSVHPVEHQSFDSIRSPREVQVEKWTWRRVGSTKKTKKGWLLAQRTSLYPILFVGVSWILCTGKTNPFNWFYVFIGTWWKNTWTQQWNDVQRHIQLLTQWRGFCVSTSEHIPIKIRIEIILLHISLRIVRRHLPTHTKTTQTPSYCPDCYSFPCDSALTFHRKWSTIVGSMLATPTSWVHHHSTRPPIPWCRL